MEKAANVKNRLKEIDSLPSLPLVLRKIQRTIKNPNSSMGDIANAISQDPALASKAIRLVNSAYYGASQPVTSIKQAIIILGLQTVANIVTALGIIRIFPVKGEDNVFNHDDFWKRSLTCGHIAEKIAKKIKPALADDCFMAGLLHDIGHLLFDQFFNREFTRILYDSKEDQSIMIQSEEKYLGLTHADAGAILCSNWQIPESIAMSIKYHHTESQKLDQSLDQYGELISIISLSSLITHILSTDKTQLESIDIEKYKIPMTMDDLTLLLADAQENIEKTIREWKS